MADWPTIPDASGNAIPGTAVAMEQADIALDTPGGTFSRKSFAFDGVAKYLTVGDVLNFEYNEPRSVSFWVKPGSLPAFMSLMSKVDSAPTYRGFTLNSGLGSVGFNLYNDVGAGRTISVYSISSSVLSIGVWTHLCWTYDGSGLASGIVLYVNGVSSTLGVIADTLAGNTIVSTGDLEIARRVVDGGYVDGSMTEPAVYSDVLSAAEALWIYNSKSPRDLLDGSAPDNLEAWWRADGVSWPQSAIPAGDIAPIAREEDGHERSLVGVIAPAPPVQYYQMRGIDSTCPAIQQPAYVFWTVVGTPDYTAAQLSPSALPCGSDPLTDVVDIQIAGDWQIVPE